MHRNTEIGPSVYHLLVSYRSRFRAVRIPIRLVLFCGNILSASCEVERHVDSQRRTMNDHEVGPVPREQPRNHLVCEVMTSPPPVTGDEDTNHTSPRSNLLGFRFLTVLPS